MTVRNDIYVLWELSPRLVIVKAPSQEITVQDLVDTLRYLEADINNLDEDSIIKAAGKDDLGGGVKVGITATLLNARLMFETRSSPITTGTVTQYDETGEVLVDSNAQFITDGIYPGCTAWNQTTQSMGTVKKVLSETSLQMFPLSGGSQGGWHVGDSYSIYPNEQCSVTGGNLVAVDANGDPIEPIAPSANVQVVRTTSSSATLQELQDIQFASFNGGVTIDPSSPYSGTAYPVGTLRQPVNNMVDALAIAQERGFDTFFVIGDLTLDDTLNLQQYTFIGESPNKSHFIIQSNADVTNCTFIDAEVTGVLDGGNVLRNCLVHDLTYVNGYIEQCILGSGDIVLGGGQEAHFLDCWSGVVGSSTPTIDLGGSGQGLGIRNYNGGIKLKNKTGPEKVSVDLNSGHVILDSTITAGEIVIRGIGEVTNNAGGTATVDTTYLVSPPSLADAILDDDLADHVTVGTVGGALMAAAYNDAIYIDIVNGQSGTSFPIGTAKYPVNNFADAKVLASLHNIRKFHLFSSLTIGATENLNDYIFEAPENIDAEIFLTSGCSTTNARFSNLLIKGTFNGKAYIERCTLSEIFNFSGIVLDSVIMDNISLIDPTTSTLFFNCSGGKMENSPININIGDANLTIAGWQGPIKLAGKTGTSETAIDIMAGTVEIDSTCVAGTIVLRGVGLLVSDSSGPNCTVKTLGLLNREFIADAVLDESLVEHTTSGSLGEALAFLKSIEGGRWKIENNQMIFYDEDNTTEIARFNLYDSAGQPATQNVFERRRV